MLRGTPPSWLCPLPQDCDDLDHLNDMAHDLLATGSVSGVLDNESGVGCDGDELGQ